MPTSDIHRRTSGAKGAEARAATLQSALLTSTEDGVARWHLKRPHRTGRREEVAAHEAGHCIAFEAEGLGLVEAEVHPVFRQGTFNGWTGTVRSRIDYIPTTADAALAMATTSLAGPAGGAIFAGGDTLNHSVEVMEAAAFAARLSEKAGIDFVSALAMVTQRTARILQFHRSSLLWFADRLARRKSVSRREPKVARVLDLVAAVPAYALPPAPEQERVLAEQLSGAPIDLATFGSEIVHLIREAGL